MVSLGAGLLVGVLYSVLNVRSPAPPLVALVDFLGTPVDKRIFPVGMHMLARAPVSAAWKQSRSTLHIFGMLPGRHSDRAKIATDNLEERA
jgi:XapX domain-containing protein